MPNVTRVEAARPAWTEVSDVLWRIHTTTGDFSCEWGEFRRWGPHPAMRFDPHPSPIGDHDVGVLYAAADVPTALAEVFWETRRVVGAGRQLTAFRPTRPLRLLDLREPWVLRAGGAYAINNTDDRAITQAWARVLHGSFPDADGLVYSSSLTGRAAYALYDPPVGDALVDADNPLFAHALDSPALRGDLHAAVAEIGYRLL